MLYFFEFIIYLIIFWIYNCLYKFYIYWINIKSIILLIIILILILLII